MRRLAAEDQRKLDDLYEHLVKKRDTYLGYPNSVLLDNYDLGKFLDLTINNAGDPFRGNNMMNTCTLEREVVDFFRKILHAPIDESWGYVTNGGTEGNLYGLYMGRESFPDGIIYHSEDSHYSIPKAARLLNARNVVIRSSPNGEMDYDHLEATLKTLRHYPVILNANVGTTMKGAIDDVDKIHAALKSAKITRYHIHCDAALFGAMLPFMKDAPAHDFRKEIHSLAISGHKFLGSPIPSGIVVARKHLVDKVESSVEYIGSRDSTISGSRDGFSVLILWQSIKRYGVEGFRELVEKCFDMTHYTLNRLRCLDWPSWVNPHSNIVMLRRPNDEMVRKWQLATQGDLSHVILMPGVTTEKIDRFIHDLEREEKWIPCAMSS